MSRHSELAAILREEGCCFAMGKEDYPLHRPNNVCRCPDVQASLMINNTPGVALHLLETGGGESMSEQTPEQTDEGADAGSENTALPDQAAGSEAAGEAGAPAGSPSIPAGENADTTSDEPQGETPADNTEGAE